MHISKKSYVDSISKRCQSDLITEAVGTILEAWQLFSVLVDFTLIMIVANANQGVSVLLCEYDLNSTCGCARSRPRIDEQVLHCLD